MLTIGTGLTLILQAGGIAIGGSFIAGILEARGSTSLASVVTVITYCVIGALGIIQLGEFISFAKAAFHL